MRLRFASLTLAAVLSTAGAAFAADLPKVSDAIAAYETRAASVCATASTTHSELSPAFWSDSKQSASAQDQWHKAWPLNAADEQAGAFSMIMAAQVSDFVSVLGTLNDSATAQTAAEDQAFLSSHARAIAGAAFSECLVPSAEAIDQLRDQAVRKRTKDMIAAISCRHWFEAQTRVLALPLTDTNITAKVQDILDDTVGSCEVSS